MGYKLANGAMHVLTCVTTPVTVILVLGGEASVSGMLLGGAFRNASTADSLTGKVLLVVKTCE